MRFHVMCSQDHTHIVTIKKQRANMRTLLCKMYMTLLFQNNFLYPVDIGWKYTHFNNERGCFRVAFRMEVQCIL